MICVKLTRLCRAGLGRLAPLIERIWRRFSPLVHGPRARANHVRDILTIAGLFYVILILIKGMEKVPYDSDPDYRLYHVTSRDSYDGTAPESQPSRSYNDSNYILKPNCSVSGENTMLVFVHSRLTHIGRRAAIRATWGNVSHYGNTTYDINIMVIFSLGFYDDSDIDEKVPDRELLIEIKAESTVHKDILFLDMVDRYDNLAYKSLLAMQWVAENCPHTKFIYKTDDDVLLNTFGWLRIVLELRVRALSCCIVCCAWEHPAVFRIGKSAVSKQEYSADSYPDFCSGSGYLMSRDAMDAILEVASHVALLKRDDPYFTGVLAKSTDVSLIRVEQSAYLFSEKERISSDDKPVLVMHDPTPIQWGYGWEGFLSKHQHPVLRNTLSMHTFGQNRSAYIPLQFMLPFNTSLTRQCRRPTDVLIYIEI